MKDRKERLARAIQDKRNEQCWMEQGKFLTETRAYFLCSLFLPLLCESGPSPNGRYELENPAKQSRFQPEN